MEHDLANLRIDNKEDEAWELHGEEGLGKSLYEYCLVGYFLITSVVHFQAVRNAIANLWHPLRRVLISDLGESTIYSSSTVSLEDNTTGSGGQETEGLNEIVKDLMEHDSKDRPIENMEGKKRPRNSNQESYASKSSTWEEHNERISTAAMW
ncbi:hypothetical protein PVK06_007398 [Gossypium arboreum]|uniref:Uncharacterized protein n=1 Tax=Gossypium arboreum TaxID=29729 RepID=A0ABR0QHE7_GOSAR|nr:hypothetical protein PVK06_007398 [Gossypium arboreum]